MKKLINFTHKIFQVAFVAIVLASVISSSVFAQTTLDPIGTIDTPQPVEHINTIGGIAPGDSGLIFFISMLIQIVTIVAGLWVVFNFSVGGWHYFGMGGNTAQAHTKAISLFTNSIVGIICILASYTMAGIVGYIFYGDAAFILNPTIPTI